MIFHRWKNCRGMTLFRWGRLHIELWYFPAGTVVPSHAHPQEDIEVMYLFGSVVFHRQKQRTRQVVSFVPRWYDFCRLLSIPRGDSHWFTVGKWPLIAVNFEIWQGKPTTAADDFVLTNN